MRNFAHMNQTAGKIIIIAGLLITVAGLIVYFMGGRLNFFGRLPGDIRIEKENSSFYFPITTCLLISLLISLIIRLVQWFIK
jgi:hypothetical protein